MLFSYIDMLGESNSFIVSFRFIAYVGILLGGSIWWKGIVADVIVTDVIITDVVHVIYMPA